MYKIAVVGRGLIGSAAGRHLAESTDGIVVIGPDEPEARAGHDGVFASHYDEGRMTRHVDPTEAWSITAGQSIKRYRDLEARSGVSFYNPVGYLGLGYPGSTYNDRCAATGQTLGAEIYRLETAALCAAFPYLNVPDGVDGLVERGGAGYISPRRLVAAQNRLAEQAGAHMLRQPLRALRTRATGVALDLWDGTTVHSERALIATGAFTTVCGLSPVDLGLTVYGRTTVLVRTDGETAETLRDMPTMIDTLIGAYILPPIRYPDGKHYLKIGVGDRSDPSFTSLSDLQAWFASDGSHDNRIAFTERLKELIPALTHCATWHTDTCAVTHTQSGLPIIDHVDDRKIVVAVGGCGKGAKGSDEWGRIAAGLILDLPWSSAVDRGKLRAPT
ncbi:MAG: FAD-dependent oxidoreductase [Pseudomonadota bacterium]